MTRGRRPAGICGAALLLAARMNNFRRSVEEIVQVVKIADTTLKKRLDEFKATPSGALTLQDFRNVWLEEEMDPPAFTKGKEKEEAERLAAEKTANGETDEAEEFLKKITKGKKGSKKRQGKRKRCEETDGEDVAAAPAEPPRPLLDPSVVPGSIIADAITINTATMPPQSTMLTEDLSNIDPALLQQSMPIPAIPSPTSSSTPTLVAPPTTLFDETANEVLVEEVTTFLQNSQGTQLTSALDEAEERRLAQISVVDELTGLNEEELDRFILSEEEVKIKERVWVELNREYLEALAGEYIWCFLFIYCLCFLFHEDQCNEPFAETVLLPCFSSQG